MPVLTTDNPFALTLLAFLTALGLSRFVIALVLRIGWVDKPNGRKLHDGAVPLAGGLIIVLAISPLFAFGQKDFPNRTIRVLVPFTAGSGSDTAARFFGDRMAREFIKATGGELMPYPPEAMRKFQRDELDRFRRIAEAAGIKPE